MSIRQQLRDLDNEPLPDRDPTPPLERPLVISTCAECKAENVPLHGGCCEPCIAAAGESIADMEGFEDWMEEQEWCGSQFASDAPMDPELPW